VKDGNKWAIIDQSGLLARAVYVEDDDDWFVMSFHYTLYNINGELTSIQI
jgi:hypothetical protein